MRYLLLPILCIFYFELLGQTVMLIAKMKPLVFNAVIGFATTLACYYVICFIPIYLHLNFKVVLLLLIMLFVISILLIIKNRKKLFFTFSKKQLFIMLLVVLLFVVASSYGYIGDIKEYDTLSYSNLIGNNIYQKYLNSVDFENGLPANLNGYAFQAYYMLASGLLYITNGISQLMGIKFFFYTQYIWLYSIIFYFIFAGFFINVINDRKQCSIKTIVIFGILYLCFFGGWYWHLYQPYIGNSFRFLFCSYALFYIKKYSDRSDDKYLTITLLILLAGAACSNSNSVILVLFSFGIVCVFKQSKRTLIMILSASFFPLLNIILQLKSIYTIYAFILLVGLLFVVIVFGDKVVKVLNNKRVISVVLICLFVLLLIVSYLTTNTLFDINTFLNNIQILDDMRWSLTDFSTHWAIIANILLIFLIVLAIKNNYKENWAKVLILIVLLFFTPFTVGLFNKYDRVWFRCFEIIFNGYIVFMGINILIDNLEKKDNRVYKRIIPIVIIVISIYVSVFQFFDSTFMKNCKKPDNYNFWLKMTDDEADALEFAKHYIVTNNLKNVLVSSAVYQLRSEVPTIRTVFNRRRRNNSKNKYEELLIRMLYPDEEYFGACYNTDNFDYSKLSNIAKSAGLKLMILGKNKIYHDKDSNEYYPLYLYINKTKTPIYENGNFVIYDYR